MAGSAFRLILVVLSVGWLTSCTSLTDDAANHDIEAMASAAIQPLAVAPPPATLNDTPNAAAEDEDRPRLVFSNADRSAFAPGDQDPPLYRAGRLQLNFVNASAAEVTQVIVNEALGLPVAVANGVNATITLTAPDPIPTQDALDTLEAVLGASGLSLVEVQNGFMLTPTSNAEATGARISSSGLGYGLSVVRVENTNPTSLARLIQPFVPRAVQVTPDDTQGLILLRGPGPDITRLEETITQFDTPALSNRVYGLFELRYTDASTIEGELNSLLRSTLGEASSRVEIISISRLNQLFVLTANEQQVQQVEDWIERLDRPAIGDERRLYYYLVQNAPADQLAIQLESAFRIGVTGRRFDQQTSDNTQSARQSTAGRVAQSGAGGDGLSIVPDELNNALIIRATGSEYRDILNLVERMDVLPPQVLIEATIAEVRLSDDLQFGIRWFFTEGNGSNEVTDVVFTDAENGAVGSVFPGFAASYFVGTEAGLALNALASITDVEVLSAPSIMVLNNQSANLNVGDQVPVVTQQAQGTADADALIVNQVELRDTGVILDITPRINASGMVVLEVEQEVSGVIVTETSGIDSPTIQQRQFSSIVAVPDGETIILGGLIQEQTTDNESGVPVLRRIPVLGEAFKSRTQSTSRTELIIFLTPTIVRTPEDNSAVRDALRRELGNAMAVVEQRSERHGL